MRSLLSHRAVQTILVLVLYAISAPYLPLNAHRFFYTISLFIKDLLVWLMPVTIFFFITHTIMSFEKKAPVFILTLVVFEAFFNFTSVWYAFGSGALAVDALPAFQHIPFESDFSPLWRQPFTKPSWWAADKGCFVGLVMGLFLAFTRLSTLHAYFERGKGVAQWILTNVFARIIPLFVLGFMAHIYKTDLITHIFKNYDVLVLWLLATLVLYLVFLAILSAGGFQKLGIHLKNILPAAGIAFTSGCSLSTMPWTIKGASKNLRNPDLAQAVIPATTNIQQVGDCVVNAFLCFLIYKQFFGVTPDASIWIPFSIAFTIARFATAAVLGGAIFVMLPIYEQYLNFNTDMIAFILAFNVILDPIVTSSNVLANGALCRVFERIWDRVSSWRGKPVAVESK